MLGCGPRGPGLPISKAPPWRPRRSQAPAPQSTPPLHLPHTALQPWWNCMSVELLSPALFELKNAFIEEMHILCQGDYPLTTLKVMWAEKLGKQLGKPTRSLGGWLLSKFFKTYNKVMEVNAVKLLEIQPGETVLELGHGPGLGLQAAAKLLTGPAGHVIGVDYSEYMHQMAKEQMKELITSGKVTLHLCDVDAMPLADNTVDKVFHCNCYCFWPDLRKTALDIHRIMKPGGRIVTTMRLSLLKTLVAKGVIPGENWRPEAYMAALRDSGFTDVRMEDKQDKSLTFQAISATALK